MGVTVGLKAFVEKYIFKTLKNESDNYVYRKSLLLKYGITIWSSGGVSWVICYPFTILLSMTLGTWIAIDHALNYSSVNLATKFFEYYIAFSFPILSCAIYIQTENIETVSRILDKWWKYMYLEKEHDELKAKTKKVVEQFSYVYFNFMRLGAPTSCLLHIWRCYSNAEKDPINLLLFRTWSPFPLSTIWGFSITFFLEFFTFVGGYIQFASIITYFLTCMMTISNHCKLISLSLESVDERVSRRMKEHAITEENCWMEIRNCNMQKELRNSVIHLQTIIMVTKVVFEIFAFLVNFVNYLGIAYVVICCGQLATERENKVIIANAATLTFMVLLNQYTVARINQLLTDQIDNLRFAIYDSAWYAMTMPCKKMIHILQSMVIKNLTARTFFGSSADLEFFVAVCNATYAYVNFLYSMVN